MDETLAPVRRLAADALTNGELPERETVPGVVVLDLWTDGEHGGALFWIERHAGLRGSNEPALLDVYGRFSGTSWMVRDGASLSVGEGLDWLRSQAEPGLTRLSRSSIGPVSLTWAIATPEVATVQLRRADGRTDKRTPRSHGFVLLGSTQVAPLTRVYGLREDGERLPGEGLLL